MKRRAFSTALTALVALAACGAAHADTPPAATLPPEVASELPGARVQGSGRMRVFGFHVYDARLFTGNAPVGADWAAPTRPRYRYLGCRCADRQWHPSGRSVPPRASADLNGFAFVATLNPDIASSVQRTDYRGMERLQVNGRFGDDRFHVDDVRAEAQLNGGLGQDFFQVAQLYETERTVADAMVDPGDEYATIETTRGFLSNGISRPLTINGGADDDTFVVFHNLAVLTLNGDSGDDELLIKAFALAGSQEPQRERTDVTGGAGADLVQYAVNAPVNIDGGDGFDTVIVIGTEFGDDFVITEDGVFGAGLNINFVNIESLKVDGAEGDDRFFVLSTGNSFITEIAGGLGSDTFNLSGPTPPIVSNDLLGHSGVVISDIEFQSVDTESEYLRLLNFEGISANIADRISRLSSSRRRTDPQRWERDSHRCSISILTWFCSRGRRLQAPLSA